MQIHKIHIANDLLKFSICVDVINGPPTQEKEEGITYNLLINQIQIQIDS